MRNLTPGFLIGLMVIGLPMAALGQSAVRSIMHDPHRTLESRLLPTDKVVNVTRETHGAVWVEAPTVADAVSDAVRSSATSVIAELTEEHTTLVERDSWIGTELTFRIVENLIGKKQQPGDSIKVTWPGGQLVLKNVTIHAGLRWLPSKGQQFLLFIKDIGEGGPYLARTPLMVEDGHVINSWQRANLISRPDPLNGQTLKEVRNLIAEPK